MKKFIENNLIFILPILSGVLLFLAHPPYDLGFLIFIALIPLFYFLSLKTVSAKKAFIGGTITGIIFLGKLFSWLFATAPFEWLGITTGRRYVFVFCLFIFLWLIQIIFLGLFLGAFSWAVKKLVLPGGTSFQSLFIIPALWILLEYLKAWGFGILWLGNESLLGPHWTFGNLAYTLYNNSLLIQIADIGGIYLISFLIVLVNASLIFIILKKERKLLLAVIIILVLIISIWISYGAYKTNRTYGTDKTYKIALLQTKFLSGAELNVYQKKEVFETVLGLLLSPKSLQENPDFIIAPEGFGVVSLTGKTGIAKYLLKDFWQPGQIYLENEKIIEEKGEIKSRLFYYDLEKENPIAFYDKRLLVPNGEFLPYLTKGLLSIYSFNINFEQRLSQPGKKINPAQTPKGIIGGTICSSIVSPNLQRQMTKRGAEFLVVISSDAPFHGSKALLTQNLAMSKLRAIENRRYFAQATNMGYSFLLSPFGKIIVKSPQLGNEILFSNIQLIDEKTIYTKFGDWIIILAILILFPLILKSKSFPHRILA